jgi:CHAD domain-containing protein
MIQKSKWIAVDSPNEPVTRVARRAVRDRLLWVRHYMSLSAKRPEEDVEYVHQLRVCSRRATAALATFEAFFPKRRAAWFKKQLKRIRRAAGAARDFDVLALRLATALKSESSEAAAGLSAWVADDRRKAQPAIDEVHNRLRKRKFKRRIRQLASGARFRGPANLCEPTFAEAARCGMRHTLEEFFAAAEADLKDTGRLHVLRIAGKRLRYAMEIFAGAFGSKFRKQLYPRVEELQEKLGEINDHVAAVAHCQRGLHEIANESQRQLLARLLAAEEKSRDESLAAFFQFWTAERSEDLRHQFYSELSGD